MKKIRVGPCRFALLDRRLPQRRYAFDRRLNFGEFIIR